MPKLMSEEQLLDLATNVLNFQHPHADEDPRGDVAAYIISLLQQKYPCNVDRRINLHFSDTISFPRQSMNEPGERIGVICEPSNSAR